MIVPFVYENEFDKYDEPRLHMERLMRAHLVEFDLSLRILIPLEKAGIRTLGDLCKQTHDSLSAIPQLGKVSVAKLESFLDFHLLKLATNKKGCHHDNPERQHHHNNTSSKTLRNRLP